MSNHGLHQAAFDSKYEQMQILDFKWEAIQSTSLTLLDLLEQEVLAIYGNALF